MKKQLFLSTIFSMIYLSIVAQCNIPVPPSNSCATAPIICTLDGYCSSTSGANSIDQPTTFCGSIQNNHWLAFIPSTTDLAIDIIVGNCGGTSTLPGIQAQVYSVCAVPWTSASNCIYEAPPNTTGQIIMSNLTVGNTYYLMIDGLTGEMCNYTLSVTAGSTQSSGGILLADVGEDILFDCLTQEVTLDGSNSIFEPTDSIAWLNSSLLHLSDSISFTATQSGTYYLVIQNPDGESCPSIDTVNLISFHDILPSPFIFPSVETFIDTIGQEVFLDAINSNEIDSNYILSWTTIDGNIIAHPDSLYPLISSSGTYVLEITHPETGCITSNEVLVDLVIPVSVFSPSKNTLNIKITPTITNDEIQVNYVLENTNSISMQIYNVGGVLLQDNDFGKKGAGEYLENLSLKEFEAGVYFIFIKTEEGSAMRKVVKM
ncbi:MAG: T9SS type A sorting domain-containing protein [Saprospiraceae bacterium]